MIAEVRQPAAVRPSRPRHAPRWPASLRAVVRRGLLDRRRAVLLWGGSLGALGAFMAAIYPSIQSSIESIAKNYPAGLKEAFGVQAMNTVEGYVHAEMFSLIVPLAIGYFAIRAVAGAIVGAEERGHLDTTLSLPMSRWVLIVGSYLVAALVSVAILALTGAMTFIAGRIAGNAHLTGIGDRRLARRVAARVVLRGGLRARLRSLAWGKNGQRGRPGRARGDVRT